MPKTSPFKTALLTLSAAALVAGAGAVPARAQDGDGESERPAESGPDLNARVVLGGVWAPDYLGSDDHEFQPYPEADVSYGEYYAKLRGSRLRLNVVDDPNWHAGPFIAWTPDRNDVEDDRVERLPGIDPALEVGGFVEYEHSVKPADPRYAERVRLMVRQDVTDAHGGWLASLRGTIQRPLFRPTIAALSAGVTYASDDYMDTYFGVSPTGAAQSGLAAYEADGGVRDVNVSLAVNQFLSRTWSVGGRVTYMRLLGDAADSPVVEEAGSADQLIVMLGVGYRF
ncbi:MipA/OmpV family protein [Caenispirillum salinarum]|nr:MipA/OmpV family protein [Caenispirillum salinarum]